MVFVLPREEKKKMNIHAITVTLDDSFETILNSKFYTWKILQFVASNLNLGVDFIFVERFQFEVYSMTIISRVSGATKWDG